jgi:hypothetical protein
MKTEASTLSSELVASPSPSRLAEPKAKNRHRRRNRDALGLAWMHGAFHAAVFHRQALVGSWHAAAPVRSLEEFEHAFDAALAALDFGGEEVFLLLAHDEFVHQPEQAPSFSDSAARAYLRGRVERHEKEHEPVLWVSERTLAARDEGAFVLHLLPSAFYGKLNSLLLARRLDLTRILPMSVPLRLVLGSLHTLAEKSALLAAETGEVTTVIAARGDGELLFSRTLLARLTVDPARLGVEVNRSLLYSKQQFATTIDHVWLIGAAEETAVAEIATRCGAGKEIIARASTPVDWLQAVARLTPRHPVNLVAGYLGRKRRHQFIRRILISACWLAFGLAALDAAKRTLDWREERPRLAALRASEAALQIERERLALRNAEVEKHRAFVRAVSETRPPPVPAQWLRFLSTALPPDAFLTDCQVKWDDAAATWSFRLEGQIEGDEDTARDTLGAFQKTLSRSALHARFQDASRVFMPAPAPLGEPPAAQRFSLEGVLFENAR